MPTFPRPFVIAHGTPFCHGLLYIVDACEEFLLCRFIPGQLVQVVLTVAQQCVGRGAARCLLNKTGVRQRLKAMRVVGALGNFPGFLFNRNEL